MCGITGIFRYGDKASDLRTTITHMTAALTHRGPDSWGTYVGKGIALGHARLSILDLPAGHQPMVISDWVISFNGELYNHIELRQELQQRGVRFLTRSDTEVVIRAYMMWGTDAFARFNGQFALIIWDRKARRLVVVRDRYGIRPLYVMRRKGAWYFASEMKAYDRLPQFRREYDMQHMFEHGLLWNTIGSDTVFKGIRAVEAGTFEIYSGLNEPSVHRYYSLGSQPQERPVQFEEAQEELRAMLFDAVRLRLRSDVPVGVYLSGGIDSSVIAHLTSQIMGTRFRSFSVTFKDLDFDESGYQKEMVAGIGSEHFSVPIDYDVISENFLDTVYHAEKPLFRTAPTPLYLLSNLVRSNDIKVVLTGEAADEILYGYDSYKELKLLEFWARNPDSAWRPLLIKRLYPHIRHYTDQKSFGLMRLYYEGFLGTHSNILAGLNIRIRNNTVLAAALNKAHGILFSEDDLMDKIRSSYPEGYKSWSVLQRNQFLEMKTLLSGYLLSSQGDRMSLGHGVEGRFPFLDHRFVERAFSWPDSYKLNGFSQKHILRSAFRGLIPKSIIDRPKLPYQAPDLKTFIRKGKPVPLVKEFLSPEIIKDYGLFDERFIARFLRRISERPPDRVGYRDNMTLVFVLSAQMALYWARNPRQVELDERMRTVDIMEGVSSS